MKNFYKLFLLVLLPHTLFSQNASQGPNNPALATYEAAGCLSCPGTDWTDANNILQADNVFANTVLAYYPFCFQANCCFGRGIMAQDFGFAIPANAVINGVIVDALHKAGTSNSITDTIVQLLLNGNPSGTNHAILNYWPLLPQYETYGTPTNLWGLTLTPADINSNLFGATLKPLNKNTAPAQAFYDHVQITVHYTLPVGIQTYQQSSQTFLYDALSQSLVFKSDFKYHLSIFDAAGRMVYQNTVQEKSIPLHFLAPGSYTVVIENPQRKASLQFTKHQ